MIKQQKSKLPYISDFFVFREITFRAWRLLAFISAFERPTPALTPHLLSHLHSAYEKPESSSEKNIWLLLLQCCKYVSKEATFFVKNALIYDAQVRSQKNNLGRGEICQFE